MPKWCTSWPTARVSRLATWLCVLPYRTIIDLPKLATNSAVPSSTMLGFCVLDLQILGQSDLRNTYTVDNAHGYAARIRENIEN